ncbi:hypothetical protein F5Y18DRAFT_13664 [Xylariaceae sp. FL1019]|nr:hypothetical protein F5Y18DRAFT_13664 [Xylariaceae sp. FL1019]
MAPPPATPAPHRFLVPKRSQPRTETPKPKANAFQPSGSGQQFQATPRFSLHSTPRATPSSTPGPSAFRNRAAERVDILDSSPPDDLHEDHDIGEVDDERYRRFELPVTRAKDEVPDDEVVEESSPLGGNESLSDEWQEREVKRRRISLSSSMPGSPRSDIRRMLDESDVMMHDQEYTDHALDIESSFPISEVVLPSGEVSDSASIKRDMMEIGSPSSSPNQGSTPQKQPAAPNMNTNTTQPTFRKAPRFKLPEHPEGPAPEPLPDAFSPRRKGAKYIPGGLAAELRDWLVDVEAGTNSASLSNLTGRGIGEKEKGEWTARLRVLDVGIKQRATLVVGRVVLGRGGDGDDGGDRGDKGEIKEEEERERLGTEARIILAGPGKLSGIQAPSLVRKGCLVGVKRPMWEVSLHGLGRWGVVVNWAVLG